MRASLFRALLLALVLLLLAPAATLLGATAPDFVGLSKKLKPAVVNISTSKTVRPRLPRLPGPQSPYNDFFEEFFDRFFQGQPRAPHQERSLGSGVIISDDGYILTNDHVVDGADEITVRLSDERSFDAVVKGVDSKLDLALLKIEAGNGLPVASLGSSEKLQVGEWVIAIGNPFGLEQTVTVGIVSAKGRVIGAGPYDDFIQTDASINPGNSGGPLFNLQGEVVGINTAIVSGGQGIGFAIPVDAAKSIIGQLKETGRVSRGWLGVSVQHVSEELAESFGLDRARGALVSETVKDSPAEEAGFKRGDIILSFDGKKIEIMHDLPRVVAATPAGKKVEVEIFRDGKKRTLTVKVDRLAEEGEEGEREPASLEFFGLSVSDLTPEAARFYGLPEGEGALVTAVEPGGAAARSRLKAGDLIVEVGGEAIADAGDFRKLVAEAGRGDVLRLLVQRGNNLFYTTLTAK